MSEHFTRPTRSLAGRVAIVTGAGAAGNGIGNGRAAAILLAEAGCSVVCVDMKEELAQRTVQMISQDGFGRGTAVRANVTDTEECRGAVAIAMETYGRLDILVNGVGVGGAVGTAVEVDLDAWARGMEVNVGSMVRMSKFAIPAMGKNRRDGQQCRGSIVNIASVAGIRGGNPHLLYPTSKGAVVNLTRAMAAHHADEGIRVNCVCPGMVYTPMMYAAGMSEEARESRKQRSLLKTEGTAWDVGAAIRFLAGDEARWMTGVILPVDAGATVAAGSEVPKEAMTGSGQQ
ncbi:related to short-chain alcohol dehydrogenase [Lecanosticta acicola]|uniref:Related to short-chain alcohol dehydrogenase n=1 Tax=Lecanosticta acicola TaxID=111012 RepID=A0AAI8Z7K9_9PEZI|nr:related to short-chain alcohol dehydrogenase [Lecanosticta acicola]